MAEIKKFLTWAKKNWILVGFVLLLIVTLVVGVIFDIKEGWNNDKTLRYLFVFVVVISGISVVSPLQDYKLQKSKLMVKSNNELYRYLERIEKENKLDELKLIMDQEVKRKYLIEINKILKDHFPKHIDLDFDTIGDFFNNKVYLKEPYNIDPNYDSNFYFQHIKYEKEYSEEFENVFSKYKSGDLVRPAKFPLFNCILPLLLAILGLFATIYSSMYISGELTTSLIVYIVLFGEFIVMSFMSGSVEYKGIIQEQIEKNEKIMSFIKN